MQVYANYYRITGVRDTLYSTVHAHDAENDVFKPVNVTAYPDFCKCIKQLEEYCLSQNH